MFASKPDSLSMETPVTLIRSRIREKRLFEARFLYRQLGDAIDEGEKAVLERELAGLMQQVDTLQRQARTLLAEGQREQAARLYREMEAIAVDVPGLVEDKRALEGAAALAAKIASRVVEREPEPEPSPPPTTPTVAPPVEDGQDNSIATSPEQGKKRAGRVWLAAGLAGLALLLLLLVWRSATKDPVHVVPPAPPAHNILIRPLVSDSPAATEQSPPAVAEQPPAQKAEPEQPPPPAAERPVAPSRPLTLGTLQIQESGKK